MSSSWWTRVAVTVLVTLGCIWLLVPTYYSFAVLPTEQRNDINALEAVLPKWAPSAKYRLNLGLDLQGGIHMVMQVDTQTALQKRTERRGTVIANYLKDKNLGEVKVTSNPEKLELSITPADPAKLEAIAQDVTANFEDFTETSRENGSLTLQLKDTVANQFELDAVDQALLVIRNRIDKWGVAEADIRKRGTDALQISLPGYQDPEKAKELIGTTAQLEFRMVDEQNLDFFNQVQTQAPVPPELDVTTVTDEGFTQLQSPNREGLLAYLKDKAPQGSEILLQCMESKVKKGDCENYRTWLVRREVPLTGESLASAEATVNNLNEPEVNLTFDNAGAAAFERLTGENVGKRMAIVLDDNVNSAPRISEKIGGGRARITLGRGMGRSLQESMEEASTLALTLKAGALPAPVSTGEIRQVGALLGPELVKKGSLAAIVGLVLVLVFMAIYYKGAGLIADVALVLNGLLILASLALFNATLTLPGIAGFVLTLGIAVDANVLINERIRDELGAGKSARAAVDQGYDRVFWTIFDANITTLLAGAILFFTGTGPVRGFATALIVGIIASFFTAIVVTRVITTYLVHGRNAQTVSI